MLGLGNEVGDGKRTQTLKLRFLYVTDSTLKPMVGIVVTTSPIYSHSQVPGYIDSILCSSYLQSVQ